MGGRPVNRNVALLFLDAASRNPDGVALVSAHGTRVTFRQLRSAVDGFSAGLTSHGFERGDRAVFMVPMSVELYVVVLGTLAAGGVAVFVDPWVSLKQIAALAAAANPAVFVGSPKAHLLRALSPDLRRVPITITTKGLGARFVAQHRLRDFRRQSRGSILARVAGDDPALITYTTGSSGLPKGVNRTHAILGAQHHVIREEFPANADDVDLTTFPVFALSNLAAGITTVIPRVDLRRVADVDAAQLLADIRKHDVRTMAASPPLFDRLVDHIHDTGSSSPGIRRIVTGGAPVRDDQLTRWRETFPTTEIDVAYGSSEAEPVASISADARLALVGSRPGFCVGKPVAAVRASAVRIVRGRLKRVEPVPDGTIGELVVAGPHVCREYAGDERGDAFAENKVRDADGTIWHRMGDTGYFDANGRFWVAGRVHSTITRNGTEFHAQLVESAVRGEDARIRRVAAVGRTDATMGERLVVVIESGADVGAEVRARLASGRYPFPIDEIVVTRTALPVDPRHNSKVDYARLRAMLDEGALR